MTVYTRQAQSNEPQPGVWQTRLQSIPWWGQCLAMWAAVLIILNVAGLVAVRLVDLREGYDPVIEVSPYLIPGIWARWDSPYYINLAKQGYEALPYAMGYFPLYPMLIRGLSRLTGMPLALAGMLIAQVSYLAATLVLYRVARLIRDDHGYALRVVLAMLLFPSAFFFFAVYAEPLSLVFSLLTIYFVLLPTAQYVYSGLALGIASSARPVGFLVNLILMIEFVRRRKYDLGTLFKLALGLFFSGLGVVLFVLYLYSITGTFTAIPEAQSAWLRQWQLPWVTLGKSVAHVLAGPGAAPDWFSYVINAADLSFTLLALGLTVVAVRRSMHGRYPWSLSIYMTISLIFLLAQQGLESVPLWGMTRWVAALFPIYFILGDLTQNKWIQWAMWLISAGLMVLFMAWWATGRWVG